jgi:hypothetical protein
MIMKKRLFLVNYGFTTAGREYNEYKLVTIKFEGQMDEEWGRQLAEAQVSVWFDKTFNESALTKVIASTALEVSYSQRNASNAATAASMAEAARNARINPNKDGYDAEMSIDRIHQLIEETAPYTGTLVLNGGATGDTLEALEKSGFHVNTIVDADDKRVYTIIRWSN